MWRNVWLNLCDTKKANSNYQFFGKSEYFDSANRNKLKFSTKARNKQNTSFLQTFSSIKGGAVFRVLQKI